MPNIETILCQICRQNPSKYKCPKCSFRTCSLYCSKAHKKNSNCDGLKDRNIFITRNYLNANTVFSDSIFLQDIKTGISNSKVEHGEKKSGVNALKSGVNAQKAAKSIVKHALSNNNTVKLLPTGMSRAKKNQSKYIKKRKEISWTIEWIFQDEGAAQFTTLSHRLVFIEIEFKALLYFSSLLVLN